ncbi:aldehyde dehydrogenase 6B2 [Perilla frutescens var. frutescens]|nr:aldehyde dehydrogenase 6B2 [Perilla frutescens var. frutescens]
MQIHNTEYTTVNSNYRYVCEKHNGFLKNRYINQKAQILISRRTQSAVVFGFSPDKSGFPDGVLNIVHGTNDTANAICDDEDIRIVS